MSGSISLSGSVHRSGGLVVICAAILACADSPTAIGRAAADAVPLAPNAARGGKGGGAGGGNAKIALAVGIESFNQQIATMNADGTGFTVLTNGKWDHYPAWSPDRKSILYVDDDGIGGGSTLVRLTLANSRLDTVYVAPASVRYPRWSPDGSKLAFDMVSESGRDIFVIDADGSNLVELTDAFGWDEHPSWSPDGSKIAFNSWRSGASKLYVMNADGSAETLVFDCYAVYISHCTAPSWSPVPGDQRIAFSMWGGGPEQLRMVNADGSAPVVVVEDASVEEKEPVWSPDGARLGFLGNFTGASYPQFYSIAPDGSALQQGTSSPWIRHNLAWSR